MWVSQKLYPLSSHSPSSLQLCQPLSTRLCLIHVGYEVITEIKARACHHGTNLKASARKDCGSRRTAGVVEDGVCSVEGGAYTLFFTLVVHTECKGVDKQAAINGEVFLASE